jgi:hypothetical protein
MRDSVLVLTLSLSTTLLSMAGCSAIVSGEPGPLRCEVGGPNPCPDGLVCSPLGLCVPSGCNPDAPDVCNGNDDDCDGSTDEGGLGQPACAAGTCVRGLCRPDCMPEVCNGVDDDCDDRIDNGLDVDMDGDGALACNFAQPDAEDCDDRNINVYPGARELCNGVDDDCDRATNEDAGCSGGQRCVVAEGDVVPSCFTLGDCRAFPSACGSGTVCDTNGTCVASMGCAPGRRCSETAYCDNGMCVPLLPVGANCARDAQCQSGRCYENRALRLDGATTGGTRVCGTPCCSDSDCRDLGGDVLCFAPGTGARSCLPRSVIPVDAPPQACSVDAHCPGGSCRVLSTADGYATMACGSAGGSGSCGRAADCRVLTSELACVYTTPDDGRSWVTACELPWWGSKRTGEACRRATECRDLLCFRDSCAGTCCSDSHCPEGYRCTAIDNAGWEMRCLPIPESLL